MAITVPRSGAPDNALKIALAQGHNALMKARATSTSTFHADVTSQPHIAEGLDAANSPAALTVSASNAAGDITSAIALCNSLFTTLVTHWLDGASAPLWGGLATTGAGAHLVLDATNLASLAAVFVAAAGLTPTNGAIYVATGNLATDTAAVVARVNRVKSAFNAHLTQSGVHITNDGTNTIATANATDLPSATTLLNAAKTAVNAHMASAPAGFMVNVIQ